MGARDMNGIGSIRLALLAVLLQCGLSAAWAADGLQMGRDECVRMALENNRLCKISEYDVKIAETMLKQAKSAYWPTISAGLIGGVMDDPFMFRYPATVIPTDIPTSTGNYQMPVPEQDIELTGNTLVVASVDLMYPLYTGGIRPAINEQARYGIEAAKQGDRRQETEVVYDVDRAYYGAVLARKLVKIADETLQRMEATLELTERLYQEGSGAVKKTDYLKNVTVVEVIRSIKSTMLVTQTKADTALVNLVGLPRGSKVVPKDTELPVGQPVPGQEELIVMALEANPQLARVRAGLGAYAAMVKEAKGAYKPKVGLFAKYAHTYSEIDTGLMHPDNTDFLGVGIGAELPLFQGFLNKNRVAESKLKLEKLRAQERALVEGIVLWIQHAYAEWEGASERTVSTGKGLEAATENRDLNARAYRAEMVETSDVIQAQFMQAFLDVSYQKTLYECIEARARLSKLVGSESGYEDE